MLADQFNAMAGSLSQSHEELEQKSKSAGARARQPGKITLSGGREHDLRQPMRLGLFVAQLRGKPLLAEQRRLVDRIDASVSAIGALLDSLLDISRLDAGAVKPEIADIPVNNLLSRMEDEFMEAAEEKGLRFRVVPSRVWVSSDPVLLERIMTNLVSNALRYTRRGGVIVGCRRHGAKLRILAVIRSRDSCRRAAGIAEFYQLANPERPQPGLGLGLRSSTAAAPVIT
jgi:signal transduction histidine kinase